jgi:hypothetical protein
MVIQKIDVAEPQPARTGRGPSPARSGPLLCRSMIRNIRGTVSAARELSDRVQAGRVHNSLDRKTGLRSRERSSPDWADSKGLNEWERKALELAEERSKLPALS